MSFVLKILERLVEWYLRTKISGERQNHPSLFSYQKGKSTESTLHNLVTKLEKSLYAKEKCTLHIY